MIVNDRIRDYLHSLESSQGVLLDTIEKEALEAYKKGDSVLAAHHGGRP